MAFDIVGYKKEFKDYYGDAPLEDIARHAFTHLGYDKEYTDYNTFKKEGGIDSVIQEDTQKRRPFADKIRDATVSVAPKGWEDVVGAAVKGATAEYAPAIETSNDASFGHKAAVGAAHLAGMAAPLMAIETGIKLIPGAGEGFMGIEAAAGGVYGLLRKPEEGESRITNMLKDAALFGLFGVGGRMLGKGIAKAIPKVGEVLEKSAAGEALTTGEKAIKVAAETGQSSLLMGGAGVAEPADTWEQRIQNILMGMAVGAGAHGITATVRGLKGDISKPETEQYLVKMKLGAHATEIIDEGLKTGKIDGEPFNPDHALTIIKDFKEKGIYTDENIDNFKAKYPQLGDGLNDIIKNDFAEKAKQSVGTIEPIEKPVASNEILPVDETLPEVKNNVPTEGTIEPKVSTEVSGIYDSANPPETTTKIIALKMKDGTIYYGKDLSTHAELVNKFNIDTTQLAEKDGSGFIDTDGKYKSMVAASVPDNKRIQKESDELKSKTQTEKEPEKPNVGQTVPEKTAVDYKTEGDKYGLRFVGMQDTGKGTEHPMYNDDNSTGSSFMVDTTKGETVLDALNRKREQFGKPLFSEQEVTNKTKEEKPIPATANTEEKQIAGASEVSGGGKPKTTKPKVSASIAPEENTKGLEDEVRAINDRIENKTATKEDRVRQEEIYKTLDEGIQKDFKELKPTRTAKDVQKEITAREKELKTAEGDTRDEIQVDIGTLKTELEALKGEKEKSLDAFKGIAKTTKTDILNNKGEQNGRERISPASENKNRERQSVLPNIREEHARQLGNERQGISQDVTTPYRLRKANQIEGQGLIHDTNGYDHPDFKEMQELASSHGFDLIPFKDTTNSTNAFISGKNIFLSMDKGDVPLRNRMLHELSHNYYDKSPNKTKIDTASKAFNQYRENLSKAIFGEDGFKQGQRVDVPFALEEYVADMESGMERIGGVKLDEGLKKGETFKPIESDLNKDSKTKFSIKDTTVSEEKAKQAKENDYSELKAIYEDMGKKFEETHGAKLTDKGAEVISNVKDYIKKTMEDVAYSGDLQKDYYTLKNKAEINRILIKRILENAKGSPKDYEAITAWHDDKSIKLTPEQEKLYREDIQPLLKESDRIFQKLRGQGIEVEGDTEHMTRFVAGKGGFFDRLVQGVKGMSPSGGLLRQKTGSMNERVMKAIQDADGNRKIVSVKNGEVVSWTKGQQETLGKVQKSTPVKTEWFDKQVMGKLETLANSLGIPHERVEKLRGMLGVSSTSGVKTLQATPEDVFMHEIGHQLDTRYNLQDEFIKDKTLKNEIRALADARWDGQDVSNYFKKYVRQGGEKIAVMFQAYLHAPDLFKEVAPKTFEKFEKFLGSHEETKPILDIKPSLVYGKGTVGGKVDSTEFIDKSGKKWKIGEATIKEIESNTRLTYHKNALTNALVNFDELKKVEAATNYLENIKTDPEFLKVAFKLGTRNIPEGYKTTILPQLRSYMMPERMAETFDTFYKHASTGLMAPSSVYQTVNTFLRNAIFFNPLIHIPNISIHAIVNRGVTALAKPSAWSDLVKTSFRATKAVLTMNDDYVKALENGASLLYSGVQNKNLHELMLKKMGSELEQNKPLLAKMGQAFGYANPANLVKAIYKFSSQATWAVNDIATLQSVYEEMGHGMSMEKAIGETGKHIPNYRIPARILNSTTISKLMNPESGVTMFGNYHYGALKSYGEMTKSLLGHVPMAERGAALDKMAMLGLVTCVIYPQLDELAKTLTGDEKAEVRRAGAATFPYKTVELAKGNITFPQWVQSVLTPSIGVTLGTDLYMGRDWTGRRVTPAQVALNAVAPIALGEKIATGERPVYKAIGGLLGVSFRGGSDFEKFAHGLQDPRALTDEQKLRSRKRNELVDLLRNKDPEAKQKLAEAVRDKEITHRDMAEVRNRANLTLAQEAAHIMSLDQLAEGIEGHANKEERKQLLRVFITKFRNKSADLTPDERQRFTKMIQNIREE
jgi:hypothetical protein